MVEESADECTDIDDVFDSQVDHEKDNTENYLHVVWRSTPEARKFLKDKCKFCLVEWCS